MPSYDADSVMDRAAALLNDNNKALFVEAVMLPYLKIAQEEMEQEFNLNEVETNLISEYETTVAIGATSVTLPASFFLPISLAERTNGTTGPYIDMEERANIHDLGLVTSSTIGYWDFRHNCINIVGPTVATQVRLYYWRVLPEITSSGSDEPMKGGRNPLAFRTAALCAEFIGGNRDRAASLNLQAEIALDRLISLYTKNNQNKRVRRKPFRVGVTR